MLYATTPNCIKKVQRVCNREIPKFPASFGSKTSWAGALVSSVTLNGFWSKLSIIEHLIRALPMVLTAGDGLRAREPIPRLPLRRS